MVRNWKKKKVPRENYSPPTVISHYFEYFFSTSRSKLTRSPASLCSQFYLLQPPEPIQKKNRNNKNQQMIQCQFLFFSFLPFELETFGVNTCRKKENPELRLYCSTNVNKSRGCWHEQLYTTRFSFLSKWRGERKTKKAPAWIHASLKCTTIGVSVCRRERQARNWRFEQTEGTGGGSKRVFRRRPEVSCMAIAVCCCCCCPPVFVSGITEGVTLASLPPLSLPLSLCVSILSFLPLISPPGPVLSHPSRTATIKRRKEIKKRATFFFVARTCVT